jgi:H+/Cl- antiporter ClcA
LYLLSWASNTRDQNIWIIWGLPFAGFFIAWVYLKYGQDVVEGNHQIIAEIHTPKKPISWLMAPFILVGTLLTHFFGGSAGREGTAVQMGSSLSDQINKFFKIDNTDRRYLLAAGAGAGFASAIGAPLAGFIFGLEFFTRGRPKIFAWAECLIAAFVAYGVTLILKAPHTEYPRFSIPSMNLNIFASVVLAGIAFGLAVHFFIGLHHYLEKTFKYLIKYPPLKTFVGGLLVVVLFYLEGSFRFVGLGLNEIIEALNAASSFEIPFLKTVFTTLTLSAGFKGGEFIPLVFIGTSLGSSLSLVLPASHSLLGALGFSSVFGAASKTPLSCSIMCMEIFGFEIGFYALLAGYISFFVSGRLSIYKNQSGA